MGTVDATPVEPVVRAGDTTPRLVAIIGIGGFIGTHIAVTSLLAGHAVVGLARDRHDTRRLRLHKAFNMSGVPIRQGDATDPTTIRELLAETSPDVLVCAAGATREPDHRWLGAFAANHRLAEATADAVSATSPAKRPFIVWIGSQAEYGSAEPPWTEATRECPNTPYGTSKLMASSLILAAVRAGDFPGCVVRAPIVFGPGQAPSMFVSEAISTTLRGHPFRMTPGEQIRRFVYAPDLASALLSLPDLSACPSLVNSPAYEPTELRTVARLISRLVPDKPKPEIGALPYRADETMAAWPATDLATSLGLSASTPFEIALVQTVDWYRANAWIWEQQAHG